MYCLFIARLQQRFALLTFNFAAAVAGMRVIRCSTAEKINGGWLVELTKVPEDFTITEKAPTMAFSWLIAPTRHFQNDILKTLCLTGGHLNTVSRNESRRRP